MQRKFLIILLVNILILLFLFEVTLRLGFYDYFERSNPYRFGQEIEFKLENFVGASDVIEADKIKIPHPFFAFGRKGSDGNLNFEVLENYLKRPKDENVIAFFGGSVAENHFNEHKLSDTQYLSKKLGINISKAINFSVGSGRQPQALAVSANYGQAYNISINIEGRNEVVRRTHGHYPPYYPISSYLSDIYFANIDTLEGVGKLRKLTLDHYEFSKKLQKAKESPVKVLSFYYLVIDRLKRRNIYKTADFLNETKSRGEFLQANLYAPTHRMHQWLRYSCMQQNLQETMGIQSFFVVQPVPQHLKTLTEVEKKFLEVSDNDQRRESYQEVIDLDYNAIEKTGFRLLNFTDVFKDIPQTVYRDACCHFLKGGKDIFLEKVLSRIADILKEQPEPVRCDLKELERIIGY